MQLGTLLALLLVVGGFVFNGYQTAHHQTKAPATAVKADTSLDVAVFSNVTSGTLTLNGNQVHGHLPMIVTLRSGPNTVSLAAPPFQRHTCTVTMSSLTESGNCPVQYDPSTPTHIGAKSTWFRVVVPMTFADLPPAQQGSVRALVQHTIDGMGPRVVVPAKQYVATGTDALGHITSRLTTEPLQAELSLAFSPIRLASDCSESICAQQGDLSVPSQRQGTWSIFLSITTHWNFTRSDGTLIDTPTQTDEILSGVATTELPLTLVYDGRGWALQSAPSATDTSSFGLVDILSHDQCIAGTSALYASFASGVAGGNSQAQASGLNGCLLQTLDANNNPTGRYIWRFGVLLAADAAAHSSIPSLPIAPQAEIDAVVPTP